VNLLDLFAEYDVQPNTEEFYLVMKYFCELRLKQLYKREAVFELHERKRLRAKKTRESRKLKGKGQE
jgi:CRISPR/Cas system endoribonuclease Cas6 (RAMP superfamily)